MKNIVITGGSKGLGLEMARQFLQQGCQLSIASHNAENLDKAARQLSTYTGKLHTCLCDAGNEADMMKLWTEAKAHWGEIHIWINNAGVPQRTKNLWAIPLNEIESILQTNLMGVVYGTRTAVAGMLAQGHGQVYNMEGFGSNGMHRPGINWYGTTKNAITYFTLGMAQELKGTQVIIGRLSPGMMVTDFIRDNEMDIAATRKIYNILGDMPDAPACYLVHKMLHNKSNNAHFVWLGTVKIIYRFLRAVFVKRDLFKWENGV